MIEINGITFSEEQLNKLKIKYPNLKPYQSARLESYKLLWCEIVKVNNVVKQLRYD